MLFDMAEIVSEGSRTARPMTQPIGSLPGHWDHNGDRQAPFEQSMLNVSGQVYCRTGGRREPGERAAVRLTGRKGWLVAFRFERCCCPTCGAGECICGSAFRRAEPPIWYAAPARLLQVDIAGNAWARQDGDQPIAPRLSFALERPWERITPDRWIYGDLLIPNVVPPSIPAEADLYVERHWPMSVQQAPPHGLWWYRPLKWLEDYPWLYETCVEHWSCGGWERGHIGDVTYNADLSVRMEQPQGYSYIFNPGDWPAMARLAFTNFTRLLVEVYSGGVKEAEIEMRDPISSPQYLYVNTANGELSIRYCPVSDDPCVDLSMLARVVPEASEAMPAPVLVRGELASCIAPGLIELRISGFHMPGMPFYWAHDIRPLYS